MGAVLFTGATGKRVLEATRKSESSGGAVPLPGRAPQFNWDVLGKADSAITQGSSGTVSVYAGATAGSESDTGRNIENVYARYADVGSGDWVRCRHTEHGWEIVAPAGGSGSGKMSNDAVRHAITPWTMASSQARICCLSDEAVNLIATADYTTMVAGDSSVYDMSYYSAASRVYSVNQDSDVVAWDRNYLELQWEQLTLSGIRHVHYGAGSALWAAQSGADGLASTFYKIDRDDGTIDGTYSSTGKIYGITSIGSSVYTREGISTTDHRIVKYDTSGVEQWQSTDNLYTASHNVDELTNCIRVNYGFSNVVSISSTGFKDIDSTGATVGTITGASVQPSCISDADFVSSAMHCWTAGVSGSNIVVAYFKGSTGPSYTMSHQFDFTVGTGGTGARVSHIRSTGDTAHLYTRGWVYISSLGRYANYIVVSDNGGSGQIDYAGALPVHPVAIADDSWPTAYGGSYAAPVASF